MRERVSWLLVLAGVSIALGVQAPGVDAYEPHDPIQIEGDAELAAPDAVADNGVRGGTGTPEDPYRIERWTIGVEGGRTALALEDVTSHVLVRDVEIQVGEGQRNLGLSVLGTENLVVENVTIAGGGRVAQFNEASLTWRGSRIAMEGALSCVSVTQTHLTVERLVVEGPCGVNGFRVTNATLEASQLVMQAVVQGVRFEGAQTRAEIDGSRFSGAGWEDAASASVQDSYVAPTGIHVRPPYPASIQITDSLIEGFDAGCAHVKADDRSSGNSPSIAFAETAFVGCGAEPALELPYEGPVEVEITDVRFADNRVGLAAFGGTHELGSATFAGNEIGIRTRGEAPGTTRVQLSHANFTSNDLAAKAGPDSLVHVREGAWSDPDTEGDVELGAADADRSPDRPIPAPAQALVAVLAAAGVLWGGVRHRRR